MHTIGSNSIKTVHYLFEKGENPKKYSDNKTTGTKTSLVPVTFDQILREVMQCDYKDL